jgi:hypothetical protein
MAKLARRKELARISMDSAKFPKLGRSPALYKNRTRTGRTNTPLDTTASAAGPSVVRGVVINGFSRISISPSSLDLTGGNAAEGNYLGVSPQAAQMGHSFSVGPPEARSGAKRSSDAHLSTLLAAAAEGVNLLAPPTPRSSLPAGLAALDALVAFRWVGLLLLPQREQRLKRLQTTG